MGFVLPTTAALALVAFALRAWWLGRQSFWLDEGFSAALTNGSLGYILKQSFSVEPNPPFYFLLLHLWRFPAGSGEYAIRFLSVIPSTAAVPVLYLLGKRLGGRGAGVAAAALAAVNPYLVWLAQEARVYSWALLWISLGAYFLVRGRRHDWLLFGLANLLAMYSHLYSIFVVAAEGLYLLTRLPKARAYLAAAGAGGVLFLPWLVSIGAFGGESSNWRGFIGILDMLQVLARNFASQVHLPDGLDPWFALLLAVFAAAGAAVLRNRRGLLLLWLLLPVAAVYGLSFKEPLFSPRYFIVVLPAFLVLAAAGLAALPRSAALAGLAVLSATSIWAVERGQTVPAYAKEDYRLAASYVGQRSQPNDAIVLVANYIEYPFQYYWRGQGQVLPLDVQPGSNLDPLLTPLANRDHIWLVEAHDVFVDPQDRVGKWLRARYTVADEKYITGIHFIDFQVRPTVAALPSAAQAPRAQIPGGPVLAGYQAQPRRGGAAVTLYWQTQPRVAQNYHLSLKLWDSKGKLAGQQDGEPLNAGLPFGRFPAAGLVQDEHFVAAPAGSYDARLTIYVPGQPDLGQLDLGELTIPA